MNPKQEGKYQPSAIRQCASSWVSSASCWHRQGEQLACIVKAGSQQDAYRSRLPGGTEGAVVIPLTTLRAISIAKLDSGKADTCT